MGRLKNQAQDFSRELDRYLLSGTDTQHGIAAEDVPDMVLGTKLLDLDFSRTSKIKAGLRHHLELEAGHASETSAQQLIRFAQSHKRKNTLQQWYRLPIMLALVFILCLWSWVQLHTTSQVEVTPQHPYPLTVINVSTNVAQHPAKINPQPLPTPLADKASTGYLHLSTTPSTQLTPSRISLVNSVTNHP